MRRSWARLAPSGGDLREPLGASWGALGCVFGASEGDFLSHIIDITRLGPLLGSLGVLLVAILVPLGPLLGVSLGPRRASF